MRCSKNQRGNGRGLLKQMDERAALQSKEGSRFLKPSLRDGHQWEGAKVAATVEVRVKAHMENNELHRGFLHRNGRILGVAEPWASDARRRDGFPGEGSGVPELQLGGSWRGSNPPESQYWRAINLFPSLFGNKKPS